ncbi:MAG: hypothetical protein BRC47_13275, partial [Cyanobacteria bacterium QS_7_48_42]
MDVNTKEIV